MQAAPADSTHESAGAACFGPDKEPPTTRIATEAAYHYIG